jgi:hypothetical protein
VGAGKSAIVSIVAVTGIHIFSGRRCGNAQHSDDGHAACLSQKYNNP